MARLSVLAVVLVLSLGCAWSYFPQQSAPPPNRIVYRHHYPAYPTPIMGPPLSPFPFGAPSALSYAPAVPMALPYSLPAPPQQQSPFSPPAPPYSAVPYAAAPTSMVPYRPVPYGGPPVNHQILYNHHIPFSPAATFQHLQFTRPQSPRNPFGNPFAGFQTAAFSHNVPKQSIFTKLKPYLLGHPGQRSLPHHPYYPNQFHPHQFTPSRPLQNRPAAHHQFPVHQQAPDNLFQHLKQEHSCSCSLHVGHLTVYKHTDMRSSYSCNDLKDCNSFCTNLFSSEDLRAQTRSDACLILGKDGSVPWFRRDQVCEPHGIKNDTKLSVDLCCKQLQPC